MKLGLITDVHEHVEHLRTALDRFQAESVDQIVMIGDVFERGDRIEETCRLLADANVIGVWGNHDYGLCHRTDRGYRERYGDIAIDYFQSLRPRLEVADCHFTHVEPWLDPENVADRIRDSTGCLPVNASTAGAGFCCRRFDSHVSKT